MRSKDLRLVKIVLGASLLPVLSVPSFSAILSPFAYTSLGNFGANGVNQYFVAQTGTNPVIADGTGKVLYTGVFDQGAAVFAFSAFALNAGQALSVSSAPGALFDLYRPIAILSQSNMTIAGSISANGKNGVQGALGAGGNQPPVGSGVGGTAYGGGGDGGSIVHGASGMGGGPSGGGIGMAVSAATGGGGGGFGGAGGDGAPFGNKVGGTGGAAVAANLLNGLQGGSGGGAGGGGGGGMINPAFSSGGGAGGGALELVACCAINVTGNISVNGGDGGLGYLGAGGGGSGGGILLAATMVTIGANATLGAKGGNGGGTGDNGTAGGGGGGGQVYIQTAASGYTNNGMILVNGGDAGSSDAVAGSKGTIATDSNFQPCPEPSLLLLTGIAAAGLIGRKTFQARYGH